jgi:hypothetical protein
MESHMAGENASKKVEADQDEADERQRSTIGFPYNNLGDAIEVAQAIHGNVGTGDCDDSQLSAWMKLSPKSSGFRVQLSAARMFGLIESTSGHHRLAEYGRMIVDPQRQREARAKAFLNVPLYKAMYEKYKNGVLPPAAALERDITGLGVAEKQTSRARQVFERSADQAGFFEHGKDRLVMPGFASQGAPPPASTPEPEHGGGNGGGGGGGGGKQFDVDPIIRGLLERLPPSGETWPDQDRKLWLQLLEGSFKLIYKDKQGALPPPPN